MIARKLTSIDVFALPKRKTPALERNPMDILVYETRQGEGRFVSDTLNKRGFRPRPRITILKKKDIDERDMSSDHMLFITGAYLSDIAPFIEETLPRLRQECPRLVIILFFWKFEIGSAVPGLFEDYVDKSEEKWKEALSATVSRYLRGEYEDRSILASSPPSIAA